MTYPAPGQIAANSIRPFGGQVLDQATWTTVAAQELINGIVNQAIQRGGASNVGLPASWPYGPISDREILAGGKASPSLIAKVQAYVNSPAAWNDPDFNDWLGLSWSEAAPGGWIDQPLSVSDQVQLARLALDQRKYLDSLIGGGSRSSGGSSTVRVSSGGGGGGGSGGRSYADYGLQLGYEQAKAQLEMDLMQKRFDLEKELKLLQFALENDPNNPRLQLERQRLEEQIRQFDAQMAYQRARDEMQTNLARARIIAQLSADPGDAVAREYFLRTGQFPVGTPVNIWTGQAGDQPMTLGQLMQLQAPLVNPFLSSAFGGGPPQNVPQGQPAGGTGQAGGGSQNGGGDELPQFARGTLRGDEVTKDGWTRARTFIVGDPQLPGVPNPEVVKLRVKDGRPQAMVVPLSQLVGRVPMYAGGTTDPWAWQNYGGTASANDANGDGIDDRTGLPISRPADSGGSSAGGTSGGSSATTGIVLEGSASRDLNGDGIDDVTGLAIGVKTDPSSPTGFSFNGTPVYANGARYTPPAGTSSGGSSAGGTAGSTGTTTGAVLVGDASRDLNRDGIDDVTGLAIGVKADSSSPTGFSFNGTPVYANGATYTPPANTGGSNGGSAAGGTAGSTPGGGSTGSTAPAAGMSWGTVPLSQGWNLITSPISVNYNDLANQQNVYIVDPATGQVRRLNQGEAIAPGTVVWVYAGTQPASGAPPGTAGTQPPPSSAPPPSSTPPASPPSSAPPPSGTSSPPSTGSGSGGTSKPIGTVTIGGVAIDIYPDRQYFDPITGRVYTGAEIVQIMRDPGASKPAGLVGLVEDKWYVDPVSGVWVKGSQIMADPFWNSPYRGMKESDKITNPNSQYAGSQLGEALPLILNEDRGLTKEDLANMPKPGQTAGLASRDLDRDGIDDVSGLAVGVVADPQSPSGYRVGNIPTDALGKPIPGAAPMQNVSGNANATTIRTAAGDVATAVFTEKSWDGGGTYTILPGDVKTADGTWIRWNPIRRTWEPVLPALTEIRTFEEWLKLPDEVKQAILGGRPTGYVVTDPNIFYRYNIGLGDTSFVPETERNWNRLSLEEQNQLIDEWLRIAPQLPKEPWKVTYEEFLALPENAQRWLLEHGMVQSIGGAPQAGYSYWDSGYLRSYPQPLVTYGPPPRGEVRYSFGNFASDEVLSRLYPPVPIAPAPIAPTPVTPIDPLTGAPMPPLTGGGAGGGQGAPAPTAGGGAPGAGQGTGGPGTPAAGGGAGGGAAAGGQTTWNANTPLSNLTLGDLMNMFSTMSYGQGVYNNLPLLRFLRGEIGPGEFFSMTNTPVQVPGLGISLPSPAQAANMNKLLTLMNSGGWDLANALYTAGGIPLSLIAQLASWLLPPGKAYEPSLVRFV